MHSTSRKKTVLLKSSMKLPICCARRKRMRRSPTVHPMRICLRSKNHSSHLHNMYRGQQLEWNNLCLNSTSNSSARPKVMLLRNSRIPFRPRRMPWLSPTRSRWGSGKNLLTTNRENHLLTTSKGSHLLTTSQGNSNSLLRSPRRWALVRRKVTSRVIMISNLLPSSIWMLQMTLSKNLPILPMASSRCQRRKWICSRTMSFLVTQITKNRWRIESKARLCGNLEEGLNLNKMLLEETSRIPIPISVKRTLKSQARNKTSTRKSTQTT